MQAPGPSPPTPLPQSRERGAGICPYAVVGLGKLGGREISYHSDLDLILVFDADGTTAAAPGQEAFEPTTNAHYFTELAQKAVKALTRTGPLGRLYHVDLRLRPTGKSGSLVLPLADLGRYYADAACGVWERQALCRARVVRGDEPFAGTVADALRRAVTAHPWQPATADAVRAMRQKLEATAGPRNLKRGPGGLTDVEFLVQLLQLKHGAAHPDLLRANVWEALGAARRAGVLAADEAAALDAGYSFLRTVEARLRVVTDRPLVELPEAAADRDKLARRLGYEPADGATAGDRFLADLRRVTADVRQRFDTILERAR